MLSQEQITQFETAGYLVFPDLIPPLVVGRVRVEYMELLDGLYNKWFAAGLATIRWKNLDFRAKLLCVNKAGVGYFQPMDISLPGDRIMEDTPFHIGPAVFDVITAAPLLGVIEPLIGPELTSNPIQHVRIKPPATDLTQDEIRAHITATDWHQDRAVALVDTDSTEMDTVWVAVTDATLKNGCLQVQSETAGHEILPQCSRTQTGIADGFIDESTAIPLPVNAGGAVLFHPLTPHGSLTNTTDRFRWSFDIRFNTTGQLTGRSHSPQFIARSRASPEIELHDWRNCKTPWEDARARLSHAPHIDIHHWISDAPYCA